MTSSPAIPLLQASAVSFSRQDEVVFGPLDFVLTRGQIALVEGDNGSGKTTLMRLLAGLLHLEHGELHWQGAPMRHQAISGQIVFLGHQLGLKADLSAYENLQVAAGLHGVREHERIGAVLLRVGLASYEDEPVRRLSAGQKKRVALARLLLIPGTLWLLDEPYANLDRAGIELVNQLLRDHAANDGAALVSSHGAVSFLGGEPQRIKLHD
ncbi:MAG: cytochrome c biogenesis heme-transporting ATPase CcmA [Dyella sp.]